MALFLLPASPDLLSYHGQLNDDQEPLAAVKKHVAAMQAMIEAKKSKEINQAAEKLVYASLAGDTLEVDAPEATGGALLDADKRTFAAAKTETAVVSHGVDGVR